MYRCWARGCNRIRKVLVETERRFFLELAYQGTSYHGWQRQNNAMSVQQLLEEAMSTVMATPIWLTGQGRTDTGVHATRFFAHFDYVGPIPENLLLRLNGILPSDVAIYRVTEVRMDAHARFSAQSRSYEYHIHTRKQPFLTGRSFRLYREPNYSLMNEAAHMLLGQNNFACFARTGGGQKTNICTITEAHWEQMGDQAVFYITANRFLRNMVRSIVGSLVEIGQGKKPVNWMQSLLEQKDRTLAGASAPACGLYLVDVAYPSEIWLHE